MTTSLTITPNDPEGRFVPLKLSCSDEVQSRCAGFFVGRIERYVDLLAEDEQANEEEDDEGSETEKAASAGSDNDNASAKKKGKGKAKPKKKIEKKKKVELSKRGEFLFSLLHYV